MSHEKLKDSCASVDRCTSATTRSRHGRKARRRILAARVTDETQRGARPGAARGEKLRVGGHFYTTVQRLRALRSARPGRTSHDASDTSPTCRVSNPTTPGCGWPAGKEGQLGVALQEAHCLAIADQACMAAPKMLGAPTLVHIHACIGARRFRWLLCGLHLLLHITDAALPSGAILASGLHLLHLLVA